MIMTYKNLKLAAALSVATALSSGCDTMQVNTEQTLATIAAGTNVYYQYTTGEVVQFIGTAKLSDKEAVEVQAALSIIDNIKQDLTQYTDPVRLASSVFMLDQYYSELKDAYTGIYHIVRNHWSEYNKSQQSAMLLFHKDALLLENEYNKFSNKMKANNKLSSLTRLIDTGLKIAEML